MRNGLEQLVGDIFRGTGQSGDKPDGGWLPCRKQGSWEVLMRASADDTGLG
jgi:hypothetical protein